MSWGLLCRPCTNVCSVHEAVPQVRNAFRAKPPAPAFLHSQLRSLEGSRPDRVPPRATCPSNWREAYLAGLIATDGYIERRRGRSAPTGISIKMAKAAQPL